jgi:hypothetical protein
MKKKLLVGLLSLTAFAWNTPWLQAGLFSKCCGSKFSCHITVRPYNAFSPVCFGNMCCIGGFPCCGPMMGGPWGPPMGGPFCPPAGDHCCDPCGDPCHGGACTALPAPHGPHGPGGPHGPPAPMPGDGKGNNGPNFTPPSPTPLNPTSNYIPGAMAYPSSPIQPAAYQPPYYGQQPYAPGYYPGYGQGMGHYPMAPSYAAPSYWYGAQQ